ncbi:MAG: DNA mismatch repair protein MutS [Planctomycetia bacterium]|nr:DNA mismatch repair protein MutS [Planctomycetia bacterium]
MENNADTTPMMKQYQDAKKAAGDALLLFRMGDFYELFFADAHKAANTLGIAVTTRDRNKGANSTPMAGFPYHQLENYLAKLISSGFKVAVCEQLEDPKKAKGIVRREVVRIITPGTVMDESLLDPRQSNYLAAIAWFPKKGSGNRSLKVPSPPTGFTQDPTLEDADPAMISPRELIGLSWCELSTGQFHAAVLPYGELYDQISRIAPSETLIPEDLKGYLPGWFSSKILLTPRPEWTFTAATATEELKRHFQVKTLEGFGFNGENDLYALCAAGAVLNYLEETQKQSLEHIETLSPFRCGGQLEIDEATSRSLELVQTSRDRRRDGSLLAIMDHCSTSMGSRLLAEWITYPLTNIEEIEIRQEAISELLEKSEETEKMGEVLRRVFDLERILSKVVQERSVPRDLLCIGRTLQLLPHFKNFLANSKSVLLKTLYDNLDILSDLSGTLDSALNPDTPLNFREGGFIRTGYNADLDEYRQLQRGGKEWLLNYQAQENERTGISNLKVGYTNVFGYFIEVSRANADKVPENYIRKQTLKNAERYITEELQHHEEKVLQATEKSLELEFELLETLRKAVLAVRGKIQKNAAIIAQLDILSDLALLAKKRGYIRPQMLMQSTLDIVDGRHPVLEVVEQSGTFVPNSACCDAEHGILHLITGPNMAGKSTFIRQTALLVIMAQIGSFIPAKEAQIGVVDRIFARVGASDELTRGQSTFMVEMIETARILNGATSRSLVILDEIGRGTSTYDGISLAWAIAEFLHDHIGCRTFFATHYHELTELAETYHGISNLNVAVREMNDEIVFLHKIVPGAADKSYGIHVARLAGVPKEVIRRAKTILTELEHSHLEMAEMAVRNALQNAARNDDQDSPKGNQRRKNLKNRSQTGTVQFSLFGPEDHPVIDELRGLDIANLSPIQALTLLERWQKTL